jgi:tetratricopeptide (TPR) repeat protein
MTIVNEPNAGRNLLLRQLPWVVAVAAFGLYFFTLNPWLSSASMGQVARVAGYSWQSEVNDPLYGVVSAPLRLLPARLVPAGVNLLSALCAALALALLARSVALLPHDRTYDQREREKSDGALLSVKLNWLAPLLAVMIAGLQLTYWEHGTNGTAEMVHLLFFAYAVRALLEYRLAGGDGWLYRGLFAMAAVATSDWLMLAFAPLYFGAIIWVAGLEFFRGRFLGRLMLSGLAGLSLYLLLPLLGSLSATDPVGFYDALRANLGGQKYILTILPRVFSKNDFLLLALISFVPVILISIRWASHFGDSSQLGQAITKLVFHLVHLVFLLVCVWVMADPRFSPRNIGRGISFLSLYWLAALSAGYFAGYFLVVFRPLPARGRRPNPWARWLDRAATTAVILLCVAAPALLVAKNLREVRLTNRTTLLGLTELAVSQLPKSACLLSDDVRWALLVRTYLDRTDRAKDYLVTETWALRAPGYHRFQRKRYGDRWPFAEEARGREALPMSFMLEGLQRLGRTNELYYLHPSFGFFFEHYYSEPRGLVHQLRAYPDTMLLPPPLSASLRATNEVFWDRVRRQEFPRILEVTVPAEPSAKPAWRAKMEQTLKLPEEAHAEVRVAGQLYSRALNQWGVELQRAGDLEAAGRCFDEAQQLNPRNVVAKINLEFNRAYRAGKRERVVMPANVEDLFGEEFRSWDAVLNANGPFDEQNICYAQGFTLYQNRLYRQAAIAFERVLAFAPDDPPSRLYLAQLNLMARRPSRAIELTQPMMERAGGLDVSEASQVDALTMVARARLQLGQTNEAYQLFASAIHQSPTNTYLLINAIGTLASHGDHTRALTYVDRLLQLDPDHVFGLLHKGFLSIETGAYADAVQAMTRLLTLRTNHTEALLNRAIAYFRSGQFDAARADYETLQQLTPNQPQIYYGLAEIALRRQDTNAAIRHFEAYLTNTPPGAAEAKLVAARLKELRGQMSAPR